MSFHPHHVHRMTLLLTRSVATTAGSSSRILSRSKWNDRSTLPFPAVPLRPSSIRSLLRLYTTSTASSTSTTTIPIPPAPRKRSRKPLYAAAALTSTLLLSSILSAAYYYLSLPSTPDQLSPNHFTGLQVTSITQLTPETSLFKFALPPSLLPPPATPGGRGNGAPIQSIYLMQPDLQIQRPYTPLSTLPFEEGGEIELVVKRYPDGEVSRWMHRLRVGEEVKMRGPIFTHELKDEGVDEVVFIVGGTGVTPAIQYLEHTLSPHAPAGSNAKVTIIYSCPTPSTTLLSSLLDQYVKEFPDRVKVNYLVDRLDESKRSTDKTKKMTVGRVNKKVLKQLIGEGGQKGVAKKGKRVVMISGPEGMVEAVAGPRARDQSQGPIGGILGQLGYTDAEVVKL